MKAVFVELPAFARHRVDYLVDPAFARLQVERMKNPEAGDLIRDSGGLRKLRFADARRGKGKKSGLRVIHYWWGREASYGCSRSTTRIRPMTCPLSSASRSRH